MTCKHDGTSTYPISECDVLIVVNRKHITTSKLKCLNVHRVTLRLASLKFINICMLKCVNVIESGEFMIDVRGISHIMLMRLRLQLKYALKYNCACIIE